MDNKNDLIKLIFFYVALFFFVLFFFYFFIFNYVVDDSYDNYLKSEDPLFSMEDNLNLSNSFYSPPILTFHNIDEAPLGISSAMASLYVPPSDFERMLKSLADNNYQSVFVSEISEFLSRGENPPGNLLSLTFDDGAINFYTKAWPLLKKYNIKASLYIMTGVRGEKYLSSEQIKELSDSGLVEIGSHTVFHQDLTKLSREDKVKELKNSKEYLEELIDKEVSVICYPYGGYDDEAKSLVREVGYKYGLTYNKGQYLISADDLLAINRIGVYPKMNLVKLLSSFKED